MNAELAPPSTAAGTADCVGRSSGTIRCARAGLMLRAAGRLEGAGRRCSAPMSTCWLWRGRIRSVVSLASCSETAGGPIVSVPRNRRGFAVTGRGRGNAVPEARQFRSLCRGDERGKARERMEVEKQLRAEQALGAEPAVSITPSRRHGDRREFRTTRTSCGLRWRARGQGRRSRSSQRSAQPTTTCEDDFRRTTPKRET